MCLCDMPRIQERQRRACKLLASRGAQYEIEGWDVVIVAAGPFRARPCWVREQPWRWGKGMVCRNKVVLGTLGVGSSFYPEV